MRRFKHFIDFDKEEKWLERMAEQGYHLEDTAFGYKFRQGKPEQAVIKIDYRKFRKQEDFVDYCTLFEDSGWQHIAGKKNSGAQYFKRTEGKGEEDIFSDKKSKAGKYKRLSEKFMELAICYLPILAALTTTGVIDISVLFHPWELYYTPGLWEKTGLSFWAAFLFETPFAFFRGVAWLFFPVMIICYCWFWFKAHRLYEKNINA
ncbi:DUF2812 domain-containing protein [Sediminibacillus massiliensis]|uniref:DUF2812 domain-containing protein n=1 Tax=Sediminibacillus massiliensis TaxID=1926277 RepID=UPI0009887F8E|nr:DUF2812 domain-containing protein [Sediminibacillus massiliensis]